MNALATRVWSAVRRDAISKRFYSKRRAPRQNRPDGAAQVDNVRAQNAEVAPEKTPRLLYPLLAYYRVVNVGAFGLFWYDKQQALTKGWRVPERTLQLSALIGGWIGGMAAMEMFRHKTQKVSFRQPYFMAVALNAGASALLFSALFGKNQAVMSKLAPFLNQAARNARLK
ncbi:hypothetical protein DFJ74DRAFT_690606 [Hyaloraphidium curvatum]|nr:hypothetical protein DFJ74DRAFT_690606 [Hyaloraphidium curvatum]